MMLRIGLTGGIGAGKSTVSATFSECGGIVVDGDVISREVVEPGTEGLAKLVDAFGSQILPDGAWTAGAGRDRVQTRSVRR
jgi:dephospho-CoA kinase